MRYSTCSHCAGLERAPPALLREIGEAIEAVETRADKGAAPRIRTALLANLKARGWSGEVPVARGSDMTITSMKESVGLCLQTGNMARMYADLVKLQTLYLDNAISSAVIVLPSQPLALRIGDNIAQASRLERELEIFRKAYHVPTVLMALE